MRPWNAALMALLAAGMAGAQTSPGAEEPPATPGALRAEIQALRDTHVAWRNVQWRTCLLGALKESARDKKPVFLWVLGGSPAHGRC